MLEKSLASALEHNGYEYTIFEGEGAFYGPKLEFVLRDAIGRDWQCGTLQVDMNLTERFDLNYIGQDGEKHRPVMLHRALFGSLERFTGILIENFAGHLPLWLSPVQVAITTVSQNANDYAVKLITKDKDEVFLYKNDSNKTFKLLYSDMLKKMALYKGSRNFSNVDELKVPKLSFFEEKSFEELCGKRIMGTNYVINQALETIKFNMDYKGVDLKSEAAMTVMTMSVQPDILPRLFYFDDTFVVFLKEKEKKLPYFALRVHDISNYQK